MRAALTAIGDVARALPGDLGRATRQELRRRGEAWLERPPPIVLAGVRRFLPATRLPGTNITLVTRHHDVIEVLRDSGTFHVTPYARTMVELAGPFALGQDGADHAAARSRLHDALEPCNGSELERWAHKAAERLVSEGCQDGALDAVTDLAWRLPARFTADHLGVPGPDEDTLIAWSRSLFEGIFLNLDRQRWLVKEAATAAERLRSHVDDAVGAARAQSAPGATALHRLAASGEPDGQARTDLVGLVVATVPTVAECIAIIVDDLLRRTRVHQRLHAAAATYDSATVWRHARESLRLTPQSPGLVRQATDDATVGGGPRAGRVAAGSVVLASTAAAMRDPSVAPHPGRFDVDRADDAYLHFGTGPHRCIGEHIAPVLIAAAVTALFRRPGLRRAPGPHGRLAVEGRWPTHLHVLL
jgi:cytochrome P450